ncbi:Lon N-terminal domain-containing protein [Novosphingobium lubricantis]
MAMGESARATRLSIFPLTGAVLFPGLQLPLHIFEPRYRAMISDALVRDQRIAMIQPQAPIDGAPLFSIGCVGKIGDVEALEDGRYNVVLEGIARFRVLRELDVTTPFRQIEGELIEDDMGEALSAVERASFEREARHFADAQGYAVDWDSVARLDDMSLINGVSQIAPFDAAAKQALLEAESLSARCELLVQLMQFFGKRDGDDGGRVTLQ